MTSSTIMMTCAPQYTPYLFMWNIHSPIHPSCSCLHTPFHTSIEQGSLIVPLVPFHRVPAQTIAHRKGQTPIAASDATTTTTTKQMQVLCSYLWCNPYWTQRDVKYAPVNGHHHHHHALSPPAAVSWKCQKHQNEWVETAIIHYAMVGIICFYFHFAVLNMG